MSQIFKRCQKVFLRLNIEVVIAVIDSDETHTKKREDIIQVILRTNMLPCKTAQILDNDTVDFSVSQIFHQPFKFRSLKVCTAVAIILLHTQNDTKYMGRKCTKIGAFQHMILLRSLSIMDIQL